MLELSRCSLHVSLFDMSRKRRTSESAERRLFHERSKPSWSAVSYSLCWKLTVQAPPEGEGRCCRQLSVPSRSSRRYPSTARRA